MNCMDRLISVPAAPRSILIRSPSELIAACAQHEPQSIDARMTGTKCERVRCPTTMTNILLTYTVEYAGSASE
eukprot:scaffold5296_cov215-Cylindrotheca_fusiformis.AAC.1